MFGFTLVWIGQLVSVLSTNMTAFALTIWVFEMTGSVTALGLMQVSLYYSLPAHHSLLQGLMVDRHNRKLMMMISDLVAGLATISILVLQSMGALQVWQLYAAAIFQGLGNAFQWPAYSATISLMVPKEKYGRANGMMSLDRFEDRMFGTLDGWGLAAGDRPDRDLVTGCCYVHSGDHGFIFCLHSPAARDPGRRTVTGEYVQGSRVRFQRYTFARPSLLGLQLVFFFGNLCMGIAFTS